MKNLNIACSWSGGKDSCFALVKAMEEGFAPKAILNVLNEEGRISRSHGIPIQILRAQAAAANLPIHLISSSWADYEQKFTAALKTIKDQFDVSCMVFGDIDLQAHREWEQKVCGNAGLQALLPLWKKNRRELVLEMLDRGIEAMIVSCNETMGERFLGRTLTPSLITELEDLGVDACGENGEYHTLVLNCPVFTSAIRVTAGNKVLHGNYWFTNLELQT